MCTFGNSSPAITLYVVKYVARMNYYGNSVIIFLYLLMIQIQEF